MTEVLRPETRVIWPSDIQWRTLPPMSPGTFHQLITSCGYTKSIHCVARYLLYWSWRLYLARTRSWSNDPLSPQTLHNNKWYKWSRYSAHCWALENLPKVHSGWNPNPGHLWPGKVDLSPLGTLIMLARLLSCKRGGASWSLFLHPDADYAAAEPSGEEQNRQRRFRTYFCTTDVPWIRSRIPSSLSVLSMTNTKYRVAKCLYTSFVSCSPKLLLSTLVGPKWRYILYGPLSWWLMSIST